MLNGAQNGQVIENYWWRWLFPSIAFGICTISINCVGDRRPARRYRPEIEGEVIDV